MVMEITKNDADLTGEQVEWKDVEPGEYKISLTVINGQGELTETDETIVYMLRRRGMISPLAEITLTTP